MKADTDPVIFLSEINQLRNELSDWDKVVSTEHLTTIILDALPGEIYSTIKLEVKRDPDFSLEQIPLSSITRKGCQLPKIINSPKGTKSRILEVGKMVGSQRC